MPSVVLYFLLLMFARTLFAPFTSLLHSCVQLSRLLSITFIWRLDTYKGWAVFICSSMCSSPHDSPFVIAYVTEPNKYQPPFQYHLRIRLHWLIDWSSYTSQKIMICALHHVYICHGLPADKWRQLGMARWFGVLAATCMDEVPGVLEWHSEPYLCPVSG